MKIHQTRCGISCHSVDCSLRKTMAPSDGMSLIVDTRKVYTRLLSPSWENGDLVQTFANASASR